MANVGRHQVLEPSATMLGFLTSATALEKVDGCQVSVHAMVRLEVYITTTRQTTTSSNHYFDLRRTLA